MPSAPEAEAQRRTLLAELSAERATLRSVILHTPAPLALLVGPEHRFTLVNEAYKRVSGGGRDVTGLTPPEAFPELAGSGIYELFDQVYATGEPWIGPETLVRYDRDGTGVQDTWFDLRFEPVRDADGRVTAILNFAVDVTTQVLARHEVERLLEEEQRARASLEDAYRAADAARAEAERAGERTSRLQALTAALAGTRSMDDVATVVVVEMVVALGARTGAMAVRDPAGDDALIVLRQVGFPEPAARQVRRQALSINTPLVDCFRTGQPVWVESRDGSMGLDVRYPMTSPVWDMLGVGSAAFVPLVAAGESVGTISFAFEGSRTFAPAERAFFLTLGQQAALAVERARLFEAERAARHDAEAANRAKSEFLAVMSHELRTPLNAIGGYAELLEMGIRGPITPQQREDLQRLQASQRHLLGLINEVLNYAKLETGAVRYDVSDIRLRDALASAEALVAPQAHSKGLALTVAQSQPDLVVRADAEKLRQVLVNLLSNAVKFTDRGGRVELASEANGDRVRVMVRDTGIGIAADQLERIFEPFVQVRSDLTRTAEGTGLGLAISRDLARGMGGDLTVESTPGRGSTFTMTLPRAQTDEHRPA